MPKPIPQWLPWTGGALIALPMVLATWPWSSSTWHFIILFVGFFVIGEKIHKYKEPPAHKGRATLDKLGAVLAQIESEKEPVARAENTAPRFRVPRFRAPRFRWIARHRGWGLTLNPGWRGRPIEWIMFSAANFVARALLLRGQSRTARNGSAAHRYAQPKVTTRGVGERGKGWQDLPPLRAPLPRDFPQAQLSAALTRSGVSGRSRRRLPLALAKALAIAAAAGPDEASPAPSGLSPRRSIRSISTFGASGMVRI